MAFPTSNSLKSNKNNCCREDSGYAPRHISQMLHDIRAATNRTSIPGKHCRGGLDNSFYKRKIQKQGIPSSTSSQPEMYQSPFASIVSLSVESSMDPHAQNFAQGWGLPQGVSMPVACWESPQGVNNIPMGTHMEFDPLKDQVYYQYSPGTQFTQLLYPFSTAVQNDNFLTLYSDCVGYPSNFMDSINFSFTNECIPKNIPKMKHKLNPLAKEYVPKSSFQQSTSDDDADVKNHSLSESNLNISNNVPSDLSCQGDISCIRNCTSVEMSSLPQIINEPSFTQTLKQEEPSFSLSLNQEPTTLSQASRKELTSSQSLNCSIKPLEADSSDDSVNSKLATLLECSNSALETSKEQIVPFLTGSKDNLTEADNKANPILEEGNLKASCKFNVACDATDTLKEKDYDSEDDETEDEYATNFSDTEEDEDESDDDYESDIDGDGEICFGNDDEDGILFDAEAFDALPNILEDSFNSKPKSAVVKKKFEETDCDKKDVCDGKGLDIASFHLRPSCAKNDEGNDSDYNCDFFELSLEDDDWNLPVESLAISELAPHFHLNGSCTTEHHLENEDLEKESDMKLINKKWNDEVAKDCCKRTPCRVKFCDEVQIEPIIWWNKRGPWELYALDRMRFQSRIQEMESILNPVLTPEHRERIFNTLYQSESEFDRH